MPKTPSKKSKNETEPSDAVDTYGVFVSTFGGLGSGKSRATLDNMVKLIAIGTGGGYVPEDGVYNTAPYNTITNEDVEKVKTKLTNFRALQGHRCKLIAHVEVRVDGMEKTGVLYIMDNDAYELHDLVTGLTCSSGSAGSAHRVEILKTIHVIYDAEQVKKQPEMPPEKPRHKGRFDDLDILGNGA